MVSKVGLISNDHAREKRCWLNFTSLQFICHISLHNRSLFRRNKPGLILISASEANGVASSSVQSEPSENVTPRQTAPVGSSTNERGSTVDAACDTETPDTCDAGTGPESGESEVTATPCQHQTLDEGTLTENAMQMSHASVRIRVCKHDLSCCHYLRRFPFRYSTCHSIHILTFSNFFSAYILPWYLCYFSFIPYRCHPRARLVFLHQSLFPSLSLAFISVFHVPSDSETLISFPYCSLVYLSSCHICLRDKNTHARTRALEGAHASLHTLPLSIPFQCPSPFSLPIMVFSSSSTRSMHIQSCMSVAKYT